MLRRERKFILKDALGHGNKRYTTEIVADNMQLMGKRSDNLGDAPTTRDETPENNASPEPTEKPSPEIEGADDLPF